MEKQSYELDKQALGSFLSQLRKEKGWTQKDLAEKLYVSDKAVSKWERGLSVPDVSLLMPLAELFGVSVTELLEGYRLEEQTIPASEVEGLIKKALTFPVEPPEIQQERVKKYLPAYLICGVLGVVEAVLVWKMGWTAPVMETFLILGSVFGLLFGAYFCFFTEETLPRYYDENRISNFAHGVMRLNIPGVYYNNRNWKPILRVMRVWSMATELLMPLVCVLMSWLRNRTGIQTEMFVLFLYLGGLFIPVIVTARRYEFDRPTQKKK